jgi:hypothetical protein
VRPVVSERSQKLTIKDIPDAEILDAVRAFHSGGGPTPEVALAAKYPPKLVLAKMQRLVDRGVLNYGVSLHGAWIENEPGG